MPLGSYMKPRRMVTGCVNKQGQEIVSYFLESEPLPGDRLQDSTRGDSWKGRRGRIRSPSSNFPRLSLSGVSVQ